MKDENIMDYVMNCPDEEKFFDYRIGLLNDRDRKIVDLHIMACSECAYDERESKIYEAIANEAEERVFGKKLSDFEDPSKAIEEIMPESEKNYNPNEPLPDAILQIVKEIRRERGME